MYVRIDMSWNPSDQQYSRGVLNVERWAEWLKKRHRAEEASSRRLTVSQFNDISGGKTR
jgi:hypothetical protein